MKINTEEEYEKALKKVEVIFDELDANHQMSELLDAIQEYEDKYHPIPKIDDETMKRCKKELGIND